VLTFIGEEMVENYGMNFHNN